MKSVKKNVLVIAAVAAVIGLAGAGYAPVSASSHREAPMISGDPKADATDVYAFVSPDRPGTATLIANYLPFQGPAGGPTFYQFGDDVLYEIKIDNNGDAVEDISYQYRFKTETKNPSSFLYNTGSVSSLSDPNLNITQTYTLTKLEDGQSTILGENLPTTPSNVGPKSTPDYAALQKEAVKQVSGGVTSFAGQSEDPFYADLGGIFDLLTIRELPGDGGGGTDGLKGYNLQSLALQIPIDQLTNDGNVPKAADGTNAIVGVWTTSSRQSTSVLNGDGTSTASGDFVQISRLGAPLVNEVVIPIGDKDVWNASEPADDAQFASYVTNPELGGLLNQLYGVKVPPQGDFGTPDARDDLVAIFLTGIPGLTQPAGVKPSEQLRLNLGVAPSANPNRMGVLGGDNAGYPNGRRLTDDTVDISIQAVAGAALPLFDPSFTPDPLATRLGDGVDANDTPFRSSFPYLALPNSGFDANTIPMPDSPTPTPTPAPSPAPGQPGNGNGNGNDGNAATDATFKQFGFRATNARNEFVSALQKAQDGYNRDINNIATIGQTRDQLINDSNQARDRYSNSLNESRDSFTNMLNNPGVTPESKQLPEMLQLKPDDSSSAGAKSYIIAIRTAQEAFDKDLETAKVEFQTALKAKNDNNGNSNGQASDLFNNKFNQAKDRFSHHISAAINKL